MNTSHALIGVLRIHFYCYLAGKQATVATARTTGTGAAADWRTVKRPAAFIQTARATAASHNIFHFHTAHFAFDAGQVKLLRCHDVLS